MDNIILDLGMILVLLGLVTVFVAPSFLLSLLGAGMLGAGGAAVYLILSHRAETRQRQRF